MICPKCGTKNRDTAAFCYTCGEKLGAAQSAIIRNEAPSIPSSPPESDDTTPASLQQGRYLVEKKLGSGGMGRVFMARDTRLDHRVVVKEMCPPSANPETRIYIEKRFEEEARILCRLRHAGLPKVTDFFQEQGKLYMIMELVEGQNLEDFLKSQPNRQISLDEFMDWMDQTMEILRYLHQQAPPVIHRDIKPANIMLSPRREIFLVDFGVARSIQDKTHTCTSVGTFGFASPEHYSGKFTLSSDIFSLGATFHFLLSGQEPRDRDMFEFPPLGRYREDIPEDLQGIFDRMLSIDRKERYGNLDELKTDLDKFKARFKPAPALAAPVTPMEKGILSVPLMTEIIPPDTNLHSEIPCKTNLVDQESIPAEKHSEFSSAKSRETSIGRETKPASRPSKELPREEIPPAGKRAAPPPKAAKKAKTRKKANFVPLIAGLIILVIAVILVVPRFVKKSGNKKPVKTAAGKTQHGLAPVKIIPRAKATGNGKMFSEADQLVQLGEAALESGNPEKALELFSQAISKERRNIAAYINRAQVYEIKEAYQLAHDDLSRVIELSHDNRDAFILRGNMSLKLNRPEEAENDFRQALKLDSSLTEAHLGLGEALSARGDKDGAMKSLDRVIKLEPSNPRAHFLLGGIRKEHKDLPGALEDYTIAVEDPALAKKTLEPLAETYLEMNDLDGALKRFGSIEESHPDYKEVINYLGMFHYYKGEYDQAFDLFNRMIKADPGYADAYNNRGRIYYIRKEYDRALKDYNRALEIAPGDAVALNNRGLVYYDKGEKEKAVSDYKKALEIKPDYSDAMSNLGLVFHDMEQYDKALEYYNKALVLKPDDATVLLNAGEAWYCKGEYDKARESWIKSIESDKEGQTAADANRRLKKMEDEIKGNSGGNS